MKRHFSFLIFHSLLKYGFFAKIISLVKELCFSLGLILVVIGAVILVACSFTGNVNNNAILGSSAVLVVVGLISYIVINKRIAD